MSLPWEQMPVSLTGRALAWGCESWMGSDENAGVSRYLKRLCRLIYQIVVGAVVAPLGVLYHLAQALRYALSSLGAPATELKGERAYEHLKAAGLDFWGIGGCFLNHNYYSRPLTATVIFISSSSVRVGERIHTASAHREVYDNLAVDRGTASPSWPTHALAFSLSNYPFHVLYAVKLFLSKRGEPSFALNDHAVLHEVRSSAWKGAYEISGTLFSRKRFDPLCREEVLSSKGSATPAYKFPWIALAYGITALALISLASFFIYRGWIKKLESALWHRRWPPYLIAAGVVLYFPTRNAYINNRGAAEKEAAHRDPAGAAYWYSQATQRGYTPALRSWGLWKIVNGEAQKGLRMLFLAVVNGDEEAMEDIRELIDINQEIPLPPIKGAERVATPPPLKPNYPGIAGRLLDPILSR